MYIYNIYIIYIYIYIYIYSCVYIFIYIEISSNHEVFMFCFSHIHDLGMSVQMIVIIKTENDDHSFNWMLVESTIFDHLLLFSPYLEKYLRLKCCFLTLIRSSN